MSFRAYRLPSNSSTDSARSVSLEEFTALGWKILPSQLSPQDLEQTARKLAQELGYPLTEGSVVPFSFKDLATNSQQMAREKLAKLAQISPEADRVISQEAIVIVTEGSLKFDVEDIISKNWIRVEIPGNGGTLLRAPAGAKYRISFDQQSMNLVGVAFLKGVLANVEIIEAKDLETHAVRKAYLRNIRQA
ncbi:hypothetical protein BT96DRAFT_97112 [Gymnopus androsaceus JB14]|uniref:Uncharacterized protein n=1 Tax=Gymnopus androsaceus JB14 TaxID=1447944 RepID=A0A6A4HEF4_9AGAR|nr:hypothetical protein BT96DRAFT_97112 [Gymnopus androsaceus JB14]